MPLEQHRALFGIPALPQAVDVVDDHGFAHRECFHPVFNKRHGDILEMILMGLCLIVAPLAHVRHAGALKFEHVGAIRDEKRSEASQHLVERKVQIVIGLEYTNAVHDHRTRVHHERERHLLVLALGYIEGYLQARQDAIPIYELVAQHIVAVRHRVGGFPLEEFLGIQQLIRTELARSFAALQHPITRLVLLDGPISIHGPARLIEIKQLVRSRIAHIDQLGQAVEQRIDHRLHLALPPLLAEFLCERQIVPLGF